MRHDETTFFCDKGQYPIARLAIPPTPPPWPIAVKLRSKSYRQGEILLFFNNESDFIAFKNSVLEVYNEYRRIMGYDK